MILSTITFFLLVKSIISYLEHQAAALNIITKSVATFLVVAEPSGKPAANCVLAQATCAAGEAKDHLGFYVNSSLTISDMQHIQSFKQGSDAITNPKYLALQM